MRASCTMWGRSMAAVIEAVTVHGETGGQRGREKRAQRGSSNDSTKMAAVAKQRQRQRSSGLSTAAAAVAAAAAAASTGARSVDSCSGTARDIESCSGSSSTSCFDQHLMLCSGTSLPTHTSRPCSGCYGHRGISPYAAIPAPATSDPVASMPTFHRSGAPTAVPRAVPTA